MQYTTLPDLLQSGGIVLIILIICHVLTIAVVLQKSVTFYLYRKSLFNAFMNGIHPFLSKKTVNHDDVRNFCAFAKPKPLSEMVATIIGNAHRSRDEILDRVYRKIDGNAALLESWLGILATLGSISPFIGLFGTVLGIINAFKGLAVSENIAHSMVAEGIAEALVNTAAGLLVAIPSVVFYNFFMRKIKNITGRMEALAHDIVDMIAK